MLLTMLGDLAVFWPLRHPNLFFLHYITLHYITCEQLFLLSHSTGRTPISCWARPVSDS